MTATDNTSLSPEDIEEQAMKLEQKLLSLIQECSEDGIDTFVMYDRLAFLARYFFHLTDGRINSDRARERFREAMVEREKVRDREALEMATAQIEEFDQELQRLAEMFKNPPQPKAG